jgi:hypothetical protein
MIKHLLRHLRRNLVAYLALFVALGGTSAYASVSMQHTAKGGGAGTCTGRCPARYVYWAYFGLNYAGTSWIPLQTAEGGIGATLEHVGLGDWRVRFLETPNLVNCIKIGDLTQIRGSATVIPYSDQYPDPRVVTVLTTDATGNPVDAGFALFIACGGGLGNETATAGVPDGDGTGGTPATG